MQISSLTEDDTAWYKILFHPNVITGLRLILLPVIFICLSFGETRDALVVFLFAEATDILDGYLARRWKIFSEFGALFDSLSDKVFHLPLFFYFLVWPRPDLPHIFLLRDILAQYEGWFIFAIIFSIEALLVLSRTSLLEKWRRGASNKAGMWGKIKTWIQALAIGGYIIGITETVTVSQGLVVIAICLGFLSLSSRIRFVRDGR
jgi:phosphatidylglycerophosphate synthase